jgi:DNA modification methylase
MTDDTTLDDLPQPEFEGTVAPEELHTDGDNPNEMTDEQFGLLVDRMAENGWLGGPIITDTDGLIADGEHRWRAAQENGLAEVPVKQYAIDDSKRRLWRQELNKIHGEHDAKRDALEYDHLLSNGHTEEVEALTDAADEDLDELLAELRVENGVGPAYEYDPDHNVYFEDCVEGMRERLDDDSVDMVFTSPPYNVEKEQGGTRESEVVSYSDDRDDDEFHEFLKRVFEELHRVVKPEGHIFVNLHNHLAGGTVNPSMYVPELMPCPWRSFIVWDKGRGVAHSSMGMNRRGRFYETWEPIYHFSEEPRELNGTRNHGVWQVESIQGNELDDTEVHPAPYPAELVKKAIRATTTDGDVILDPFMGSGTSAVAAIDTGRDYVGFELDEEGAYKPIIERRIGEAKRQRDASVNQES